MAFCLPKALSLKLVQEFDPEKYATQPDTTARRVYLEGIVGKENVDEVNTLMESKMLLKDQQRGMTTAIKQLTGLSEKAKTDFVSKIAKMDKLLSPADEKSFYADITAKRLGTPVNMEVAAKINELAQKANEARTAPTDNPIGVSGEYLKAAAELRAYIASQTPVSALATIFRHITTIMRNFKLLNPSTPLKTLTGQIENASLDTITRRIATGTLFGKVDSATVKFAKSSLWKTYRETGLNGASMSSLDDTGKLGEGHNFDIKTGATGNNPIVRGTEVATRKVAQVTNKIAIDWEHNIAFTKFYQNSFIDMANVIATKMTGGDIGKATGVFNDALKINPTTEAGKAVRDAAQYNAGRVVGTADTWMGRQSMNLVNGLNDAVPGLGSFLFQIAKIPTNIISYGVENAGGGLLTGPIDMAKGIAMMRSDNLSIKYKGSAQFARGTQTLIRTAGVITVSAIIANSLNKNDFLTDRYGASYVRIGRVWVNMNLMYAINPSLAGFMAMKKTTKPHETVFDNVQQYFSGSTNQIRNAPLLSGINTILTDAASGQFNKGVGKYLNQEVVGGLQPSFLKQLENGQGIKGLFFSTTELPTSQELKKLGAK